MTDRTDNFLNELNHEDVRSRVLSVWSLPYLSASSGPEVTRNKILNIIKELLNDQDEVLLASAEVLGTMTEFVGGSEYVHLLLPLLEILAGMEEATVRKAALKSLILVYNQLSQDKHECFVELIKNLASSEWFTSRISACSLLKDVYQTVNSEFKDVLRRVYCGLLVDKIPMVRRRAVKRFAKLVGYMDRKEFYEVNEVFKKVCLDEQDSIRFLAIENIIGACEFYTVEERDLHVLSIVRSFVCDESWRVRYMFVMNFDGIYECFKQLISPGEFVEYMVKFMNDTEDNVRKAMAAKITEICSKLDLEDHFDAILPCIEQLIKDPSEQVRISLAEDITGLASFFSYEFNNRNLLPIYSTLLRDEHPQVCLKVIANVHKLAPYIDFKSFSDRLLVSIIELAEQKQWRIRLAIIENIPLLAKEFGVQFFNEKLSDLCTAWLGDPVYSIRNAAIENLKSLTQIFGTKWAQTQIIPKVLILRENPIYLYRMTSLLAISVLSQVMSAEFVNSTMLAPVIDLAFDQVPNIRFAAAKTLQALIPVLDTTVIQSKVKPILEKLINDNDTDVRYFGEKAWTITN